VNVSLFVTCLTDAWSPEAGRAVVEVLERLGCRVDFPPGQTCCGQPMFNNGYLGDARALARRFLRVFSRSEFVITPSASCAAMVRERYPDLFAGEPRALAEARALAERTFEFTEFLTRVLGADLSRWGCRLDDVVACHFGCHQRALGLSDETPRLLAGIEGLRVVPLSKAEQCCGFGGAFAVKFPEISGALGRDKAAAIAATGARIVVCNEGGCGLHIRGACRRAGVSVEVRHAAEIIAAALEGAGDGRVR
jgi:L-lactate dehydrogenase complex protein LldE